MPFHPSPPPAVNGGSPASLMPGALAIGGNYVGPPDVASLVSWSLEDCGAGYEGFDPWFNEKQAWKGKSVKSWSGNDIILWISSIARELNICPTDFPGDRFINLDGYQLMNMTVSDFIERDHTFGQMLYDRLQELLDHEYGRYKVKLEEPEQTPGHASQHHPVLTSLDETDDSSSGADSESTQPTPMQTPQILPQKKGRGRPRLPRKKKKTEKLGRLWEFLRDLLKNPDYCPSLIVWENYEEGMFRFVHSDRVAKLWGSKKENPDMNYEKLSRAMRYYYKSKVLMPVYGRRLVYKFGPNATNWRVDNPNFAN